MILVIYCFLVMSKLSFYFCDESVRQIYMPHSFAHRFYGLSDDADLHFKVSQKNDSNYEGGNSQA